MRGWPRPSHSGEAPRRLAVSRPGGGDGGWVLWLRLRRSPRPSRARRRGAAGRREPFEQRHLLSGELVAERAIDVIAPDVGVRALQIRRMVENGSQVEAGDLLAAFDNSELACGARGAEDRAAGGAHGAGDGGVAGRLEDCRGAVRGRASTGGARPGAHRRRDPSRAEVGRGVSASAARAAQGREPADRRSQCTRRCTGGRGCPGTAPAARVGEVPERSRSSRGRHRARSRSSLPPRAWCWWPRTLARTVAGESAT